MTDPVRIGDATLYCGDCMEILPTLGKVDAVVTDPPYGIGLSAKHAKQRDGSVSVREGCYSFDDTPEYINTVVVPVIRRCIGMVRRVTLTPGTRNMWSYPPADDVGCFYSASGTGMGKWGFTCMQPILYYGADPFLEHSLGCRSNSFGKIYPNDANEINHPCAKPIRMWAALVARATYDTDVILDPFMGSGTTGVACANLGRRFIGIEIDPRYFEIACKRIRGAYAQLKLPLEMPK